MSLIDKIWNNYLVNNRFKRKRYEDNCLYYTDRSFKTLTFMSLSQLKAGYKAKHSVKKNELFSSYSYNISQFYKQIDDSEVVSFDIFDTLLFRPVAKPIDFFWFLEIENHIFDFRRMRISAEIQARKSSKKKNQEIDIYDIYNQFSLMHSSPVENLIEREKEMEMSLCYRNEFAYKLYEYAKNNNKKIIAVSDMYLPSDFLFDLLKKNNIDIEEIYVSCEIGCNKKNSSLQKYVNEKKYNKIVHIGDNYKLDIISSKRAGWDTIYLKNPNLIGHDYRAYIDYSFVGSVYSGLVNNYLYNGLLENIKPYYNYGYLYGGILTVSFCQWLNRLYKNNNFDHIIFLGRDCKIIKDVYGKYFDNSNISYMEISRLAFLPLLANISFDNFISEAFERRVDLGLNIKELFKAIGLSISINDFNNCNLKETDVFNRKNFEQLKNVLYNNQNILKEYYVEKYKALLLYLDSFLKGKKKVCLVDLGWRGSSILYIKEYYEKKGIHISGALMGISDLSATNIPVSCEWLSGFLFSPNKNIDFSLVKQKELIISKYKNLETMFTSDKNSVIGYEQKNNSVEIIRENRNIENNKLIVGEIHKGIMDFTDLYFERLSLFKEDIIIDSHVAYYPFKQLLENFDIDKIFTDFNESEKSIHGFE